MWFPSSCTNETGIYTDARVQRLRQIQQPQANNPFVNKYSKDQCGKMRHNSFGAREKAKWKAVTSTKEQMKKFSQLCISSRRAILFPHKAVAPVDRDWNGPNDNVWRTKVLQS